MQRRLAILNFGQRIVLVVALAAVLWTIGGYTIHRREWRVPALPESGPLRLSAHGGDPGWHPILAALIWIALIVLWAAASVWLLGPPQRSDRQ